MNDEAVHDAPDDNAQNGIAWQLSARQRAVFIVLEAALVPVALAIGWLLGKPPLASFAWELEVAVWGAAATVPLVATVIVATNWQPGPWRSLVRLSDELLVPLFSNWSLAELAVVSVLAGIGEEMLFRGVLQAVLSDATGTWGGLGAASALFGLVHFLSPLYALYATLVGALLGLLWIMTGNLLAPIMMHGLYDFTVLVYLVRIRNGATSTT